VDRQLNAIDQTASVLCKENNMPLGVFSLNTPGNIAEALNGRIDGTIGTAE
jgi:uridylate kinase